MSIFKLITGRSKPTLLERLVMIEAKIADLEMQHREIHSWFLKCDECGEHFTHGVELIDCCDMEVCDGCYASKHDPHETKRDFLLNASQGEG